MSLSYKEISQIQCKDLYQRDDLEEIVNTIFCYWRKRGFPYYDKYKLKTNREIDRLYNFDTRELVLPNNHLQQNMLGLATANAFHPQMWSIQCNNAKSPMEVFMDDDDFKNVIRKRIQYGNDATFAPYLIRKSIKIFGSQSVSNFRPTVAKWVYDNYCPMDGDVLDPCAGYGGRMFGAYCSKNVKKYIGVDPSVDTCENNREFSDVIRKNLSGLFECDKRVEIVAQPFEDCVLGDRFDLVFTSPPYFDTEKYTDFNETQSYIRYPKYDLWVSGFLSPLIEKSYNYLRPGGYLVLNVGQEQKSDLYQDTVRIGNSFFGEPEEIYYMRLSRIMGIKHNSKGHKTEPLIIWRKE